MLSIKTNKPVAIDSLDHIYPHGTGWDNSTLPAFNEKLFQLIPQPRLLDIGCAGGGLVKSIIDDGGVAVGVEGSDLSQRTKRAEWATIPENLFTADATEPFQILEDGKPLTFNIVTSWECFEHIPEKKLTGLFSNIEKHLSKDGILAISIATASTGLSREGIEHHVTIYPIEWWMDQLTSYGFTKDENLTEFFNPDWVRGPNTGCEFSVCMVLRYTK